VSVSVGLQGLGAFFRGLVHETARDDQIALARHRSFIVSHLMGGVLALCVFAVYAAVAGRITVLPAIAFGWMTSPIAVAFFLSRTGRLGAAHLISAAMLAGLVTFAAAITGGLNSFLLPWMIVVPLEAALSANRKVVVAAIAIAAAGVMALVLGAALDLLPDPHSFSTDPVVLALTGSLSAILYAGGLAISVEIVHEQAQQAIRQGERRYRLLAENATDMITRHDAEGGVVLASPAAMRLVGEPCEALLGEGLFERVHKEDRPIYRAAIERSLSRNEPASAQFRMAAKPKGGAEKRQVWVEMRCRPVAAEEEGQGAPRGARALVAITRDISEQKAQETELLKARDEAESASRAKTRFLANMSHELRTPLNAIIGFSDILAREFFGPIGEERYRDYAMLINESGEHLLAVVNGILDMSKIEAGKFDIVAEPFDVAGLMTSCKELMAHTAGKKSIEIITEAAPELPEVVADKRACKQMLLNLLSNAVKFTEEGGWVRVTAKPEGDMLALAVADNGIGIAREDLNRLGKPFVQAESSYARNYEGTGLGLSLVKGLARLHGGETAIESEQGVGTVVTIRLPLEGRARGGEEAEGVEEAPAKTPLRLVAQV